MGETRVDLLHLLEDLRDAYPGPTEETILTEIIANALDSGARRIAIDTDASAPAVTIADDGAGMRRRELARYHDIAASTKVRGAGIGFAGVPALAECLALNKIDFIRAGARGATYLAYRKAIQEAVSQQLAEWGDASESTERARRRGARPVERDLELVLADLADDFPLLASLVEQRAGGQRRLAVASPRASGDEAAGARLAAQEPAAASAPPQPAEAGDLPKAEPDSATATAPTSPAVGHVTGGMRQPRAVRYGLRIAFESRPEEPELAHLVESTVWVNEAHPAYRRAFASRSEGYHVAVAVALALAPLAVDPAKEHAFITAFLARWGAAIDRRKPRSRR